MFENILTNPIIVVILTILVCFIISTLLPGIERKYISKILNTLYNQVLSMKVKNTNEDLKKLAKDINDTFWNK